ncbi:hypothetical protein ACFL0V_01635 [Nanoarchaeota archaeon]
MNRTMIIILVLVLLALPSVLSFKPPEPCFTDGEIFNDNGSPSPRGIEVTVVNLATGETENMNTGYPNYPPVEEYDNDYKTVLTCDRGNHSVSIHATNGTHEAYEEIIVPEDGQVLLNLKLKQKETGVLALFKSIIHYFRGT